MRGNLLPLHEIASTDKASLAMTYEGCHSMPSVPCHSDPERSEGEESNSVQGKLYEESHSSQHRLLRQSQEIATPRQVGVHDDKEAILSMQASSPEGHSTIFYSKTVLMGDSHEPGWLIC